MSCLINPVKEDLCIYLTCEGNSSMIEIMSAQYEVNALLAAKRWNRVVVDITGLLTQFAAHELFELARSPVCGLAGECSHCAGGPAGPGQTGQPDRGYRAKRGAVPVVFSRRGTGDKLGERYELHDPENAARGQPGHSIMNTLLIITLAVAIPAYALLWHNQAACARHEKITAIEAAFTVLFNPSWLARFVAPVAHWVASNIPTHWHIARIHAHSRRKFNRIL